MQGPFPSRLVSTTAGLGRLADPLQAPRHPWAAHPRREVREAASVPAGWA
ncbi:MAG: hypothetical protein ACLPQY_19510 [Streptosporangiaceae bacterium]